MSANDDAAQCAKVIDKKYAGQRWVSSRTQCANRVKPPHRYCHLHRYSARYCCDECEKET